MKNLTTHLRALGASLVLCAALACAGSGLSVDLVYAERRPPPERVEYIGVAPGPDFVWVAGYWQWRGNDYRWVHGRWVPLERGYRRWVPGHWNHKRGRWYWVDGRWSR